MEDDYSRRNKGRFGIRTNKTLKYNPDEVWYRRKRNSDAILVYGKEQAEDETIRNGSQLVGISLNARKNWEIIEDNKNSLNSSQDAEFDFSYPKDLDVDYGPRIAFLEDHNDLNIRSRQKRYRHQLHGSSSEENENEPESETISGTNRKGFFVKEKRRKGKKGVLKPESKGNRGRSKSFNNKSDSSESDSDSAIDEPEKDDTVIIVSTKPKHPDYVRPFDGNVKTRNHKAEQRREIVRDLNDL